MNIYEDNKINQIIINHSKNHSNPKPVTIYCIKKDYNLTFDFGKYLSPVTSSAHRR